MKDQSKQEKAASDYKSIRESIEFERLMPWCSVPSFEVGDFELDPLTLRSMCDLTISKNAFLAGGIPTEADVISYIWRHNSEYSPTGNWKAFYRKVLKGSVDGLALGVKRHVEDSFLDSPRECDFGNVSRQNSLPAVAPIVSLCHEYGASYGIDPREVADIDLRIIFQCCRAIRMSAGDVKYAEPEKLLKAKQNYLKEYATDINHS